MLTSRGVAASTRALVHPSATAAAVECARHAAFIGQALLVGFAALAVAPFFLAFHGAPSLGEAAVFACALAQVGAATLVARTGRLALGEAFGFCCLVGISVGLLVGARAGAGCALAWLAVAQLETALWLDARRERWACLVTAIAFVGIVAAAGANPARLSAGTEAVIAGLAVLVASVKARHLSGLAALIRASHAERTDRAAIVAEVLGDAIVGFDAAGSVVELSGGYEALFGAPDHEISGRGLFEHVHVADRPAFLTAVADAARGDETVQVSFKLRLWEASTDTTAAVEPRHVSIDMRARRLASDGGAHPAVLAVLRDVTLEQRHHVEVEDARRSRDEVARSKDHFLASMSHELRTPLNAIIGFSEILSSHTLRPGDADKQREYARLINQSGQHLLGVVNAVLDVSKIQSGTFAIRAEPFDVVPLIDLCCDIVAPQADARGLRLVRDYPRALDQMVGDGRACKQILVNLLSNAIKFTPASGEVTLQARPEGNHLVFRVTDTGSGIAAADLARLGDPFFQVSASSSRSQVSQYQQGTGLGLSVVRGLVGLHGGTLSIESEPGKGTSVTVRLPLECRATPVGVAARTETIRIETIPRHCAPTASRRMKLSA